MTKNIELTAEEANGLIEMMHIAVKTEGKDAFKVEETEEVEA
jgi:hypothetical protein